MSRIAYVNGAYLPHGSARVAIEDRGFQFADGVYEVVHVTGGRVIDEEGHLDRLERSLRELQIAMPVSRAAYRQITREMIRRNRITHGIVYTQITRGAARRDHPFPKPGTPPTLVLTARRTKPQAPALAAGGVGVITCPDIRWGRCDIKSVSLLPNVLAKQAARVAGAYEAWLIAADGTVTEGSSTNAWIVTAEGTVVTRDLSGMILGGITRQSVLTLCRDAQIKVEERPFTLDEAKAAAEAFLTSTTSFVLPVVRIDGAQLGTGTPGPVTLRLRALYEDYMHGPAGAAQP